MAKIPKKPGVWWVALDDGTSVKEVVMFELSCHAGVTDFREGLCFRFLDGSRRDGDYSGDLTAPIIQPGWDICLGSKGRSRDEQVRVTWLSEVKAPRNAPVAGSDAA